MQKVFDKIQHAFLSPEETADTRGITKYHKGSLQQTHSQQQLKCRETQNKPNKIKKKMKLSTLSLAIQYSMSSLKEGDQRDTNWKGRSQRIIIFRLYDTIHEYS